MALDSQFLNELLARIPEASRATVASALEDPAAQEAVTYANNAAMRHAEFQRLQQQVQATHRAQTEWWNANQPYVELGKKAKESGWEPGKAPETPPAVPPTPAVTLDVVEQVISQREASAAQYFSLVNTLSLKHMQEFGQVLDVEAVRAHAMTNKTDMVTAYNTLHKDAIAAKAEAADKARIQAAVDEAIKADRAARAQSPYPIGGPKDVQVLDTLTMKPEDRQAQQYGAQAAADEYLQLVSQRPGA